MGKPPFLFSNSNTWSNIDYIIIIIIIIRLELIVSHHFWGIVMTGIMYSVALWE